MRRSSKTAGMAMMLAGAVGAPVVWAVAQDMLLTGVGGAPNSVRKGDIRVAAERHLGSGSTLAVAWVKQNFQDKPVLVRYLARGGQDTGADLSKSPWKACNADGNPCPGFPLSFGNVKEGDAPGQTGNAGQPAVEPMHFIQAQVNPQNAGANYEVRIEVVLRPRPR